MGAGKKIDKRTAGELKRSRALPGYIIIYAELQANQD